MLKNYFKLAIKVLGRKKFFTFVSLFGISFTLMILMLITAFLQTELGSNAPMSEKDKLVYIPWLVIQKIRTDTVLTVDTTYTGTTMVMDSTYTYPERQSSRSQSNASYHFLDKYARDLADAKNYSIYSPNTSYDFFLNSKKQSFQAILTDEHFWEIYDFTFVEGQAYRKSAVDNAEPIAILTEKACRQYFGQDRGIIGKEVVFENRTYKVTGVLKDSESHHSYVNAEVYIPLTNTPASVLEDTNPMGDFEVVYQGHEISDVAKIKAELEHRGSLYQDFAGDYQDYNRLAMNGLTFAERYADNIYDEDDDPAKNLAVVKWIMIALLSLFVILPVLNLVNLNISRIMERSSEIGVRKAFGAHSSNILFQFVFENVILTFIGGAIGLVLALGLIKLINDSNVLYETTLGFNFKIFAYSFLICLAFGILSGVLPAFKMSKMQIVNALKQNQR